MPNETDLSQPKTPFEYLRLYLSGFAMGCADLVPGVSGGTMAFILGVYETLLNAIKSVNLDVVRMVFKLDIQGIINHIPFRFLMTLGVGILTAIFALSSLLHNLLVNQPTYLFAFFGGLIAASIIAIGASIKWDVASGIGLVAAAIFAFFIVGFEANEDGPVFALIEAIELGEVDVAEQQATLIADLADAGVEDAPAVIAALIQAVENDEGITATAEALTDELEANYKPSDLITLFFSGMVAICAMILPGISGSFILLILGQYVQVIGAVKNFDIVSIAAVGAGALIGLVVFSRVISWLLNNYKNVTVAALTGFMVGSLRLIWSEAVHGVRKISESSSLDGAQIALVVVLLVGGFVLVSVLDHMQSGTNPVIRLVGPAQPAIE